MLFQEWVEWNWKLEEDFDDDFRKLIEDSRRKAMKEIKQKFQGNVPKVVVRLSQETFMSLPTEKDDPMWPDFTIVIDWLDENMSDIWYRQELSVFLFASETDATAFKLRF